MEKAADTKEILALLHFAPPFLEIIHLRSYSTSKFCRILKNYYEESRLEHHHWLTMLKNI